MQFMEDMFPSKRKSLGAADPTMTTGALVACSFSSQSLISCTALKTKATLAEQVVAAGALIPSLEMYRAVRPSLRPAQELVLTIGTDGSRDASEHGGKRSLPRDL